LVRPFSRGAEEFGAEVERMCVQPLGKAQQVFLRLIRTRRFLPPPILHLFSRLKISIPGIIGFTIDLIALVDSRLRFLLSLLGYLGD
jgi:hypothetical protein